MTSIHLAASRPVVAAHADDVVDLLRRPRYD
jgi:hypothetical protein